MSDDYSYYCIVCRKMIQFVENVSMVSASVEWGGWYCSGHSKDELQKAKDELDGKVLDHFGNVPIRVEDIL